jgi:hypothetical protein
LRYLVQSNRKGMGSTHVERLRRLTEQAVLVNLFIVYQRVRTCTVDFVPGGRTCVAWRLQTVSDSVSFSFQTVIHQRLGFARRKFSLPLHQNLKYRNEIIATVFF